MEVVCYGGDVLCYGGGVLKLLKIVNGRLFVIICWGTGSLYSTVSQAILLKVTQMLKKASSYILFVNFSYAIGAIISPLWASVFVSKEKQISSNLTCTEAQVMSLDSNSTTCILALNRTCHDNSSFVTMAELKVCLPRPSLLFGWAYWLSAPIFLTSLAAFLYYFIRYELRGCHRIHGGYVSVGVPPAQEDAAPAQGDAAPAQEDAAPKMKQGGPAHFLPGEPLHVKIIFFCLFSLFVYIYTGIEVSFPSYIFTFCVESGTLSKDKAAILNSLYWAIFALFRFFSILLALLNFPSSLLIMANISGGLLASIVLAIFPHVVGVVWLATALIGASTSSTFPSIVAWLAQQTEVNGKISALLLCMGALAGGTFPLTVAMLMTRVTPLSFVYFTVTEYAASLTTVTIFFIFTWTRKRLWLRDKGVSCKGEEEEQLIDEEGTKKEGQEHTLPPASVPLVK